MENQALKERVLRWLVRREYSRSELMRRLLLLGVSQKEAISLLDEFAHQGWQSDERFAQVFVRSHTRRYGKQYLIQQLAQHNIDPVIIASLDFGDERDHALLIWRKRFGCPPKNLREKGQQARFLLSRGFSLPLVMRVIESKHKEED